MLKFIRKISKKLEESKRAQIFFCVSCMTIMFICWFLMQRYIERHMIKVTSYDLSWVFQLDNIVVSENKMIFDGWAFQVGDDAVEGEFEIILCDVETEKMYFLKTEYETRDDVNEYFMCEYDYSQSGFKSEISTYKIDFEKGSYEVLLRPLEERKAYRTGVFCVGGEMTFANPEIYVPLSVEGTDLEKIVNEGVLRVYRPDYGMYVYQYEGDLYWIAEKDYGFVEGNTYIQYQMHTTQVDKLPVERLENNWLWSNIGFYFKDKELFDWNTGQYRVAKSALPTEYSITYIFTGNYIDGWIWRTDFRPWYEFEK